MKLGDVFFVKQAKASSARKSPWVQFKGHAFGLLLGEVPLFGRDPPLPHVLRAMGQLGFLSFDDVYAFLGKTEGDKCVQAFEQKYYGKVVEVTPAAPTDKDATSVRSTGLVDLKGAPLEVEIPKGKSSPDDGIVH